MIEADIERPNYGPGPADGAVEGDPVEATHEYYLREGTSSGVWECSPGTIDDDPHDFDEFVTMLSGKVGITDKTSGEEEVFVAGDSFLLPRGSALTWTVYEHLRKFYITVE